jgi:two-component system, response regulator PdtaR
VTSSQVLAFPRYRAPHREAEGSGNADTASHLLKGANVLIVEDDFIVAFDMQTLLEEQGAKVIGPAASLAEARSSIAAHTTRLHAAVLDVNLQGEYVFPVAMELHSAGVPVLFATAYADDDRLFPVDLKSAPRLAKPVLPNALLGQLQRLIR